MNRSLVRLVKIANLLDYRGMHDEADKLTRVAVKMAQNFDSEYSKYEMRTQRDLDKSLEDGFTGGNYSNVSSLENDPMLKRYKMEYQEDPMAEGDQELENSVQDKLTDALSGTYLEDSIKSGDTLYILEPWLNDEMSISEACEKYESDLKEHRNDFGDDVYDPLDD